MILPVKTNIYSSILFGIFRSLKTDLVGRGYLNHAVTESTDLPLTAPRKPRPAQFLPEPRCFPALRWTFSLLALAVLILVLLMFGYVIFDFYVYG